MWGFGAPRATAQSNNPAPDWDPPYCGQQPRVTAVYDNDRPDYRSNGRLVLYSGHDVGPCGMAYEGHSGWDYGRRDGAQACGGGQRPGIDGHLVFAAAAGTVRRSRWYDAARHDGGGSGYGLHVDVQADGGTFGPLSHLYGHLAAVFVEEGEAVERGQAIGAVGSTGNSTGPHLHFQGTKDPRGDVSDRTFDIFGWNATFGPGYRYPGFPQPHRGDGWPMRVYDPGAAGPACPGGCGTTVVEEDDPAVLRGCTAGTTPDACPYWFRDGRGHGGGHLWTHPNGGAADYWIRYRCPGCPAGAYVIEAFVPFGGNVADTHIARWEAGSRVSILDQHEEGDVWHPIAVLSFAAAPEITLNDRTDRYDYTAPADQKIAADAVRFRRIDCGGGGGGGGGWSVGGPGTPRASATPTATGTPVTFATPTAVDARTPTGAVATGESH